MTYSKFFAAAALSVLLAACGGNTTVPNPEPESTEVGPESGSSAETSGMDDGSFGSGTTMPDPMPQEELGTTIYFEFDSSEVRGQDQELISAHAIRLNGNPQARVRLEGHADERGSREYNIGLGERRAQAVRQLLMIQGVSSAQIQTVSFGEERPASMGSTERDYAENRRVVINRTR